MHTPADLAAARREGVQAALLGYPWEVNPFMHPTDIQLRIEWHLGWWAGRRPDLDERRHGPIPLVVSHPVV